MYTFNRLTDHIKGLIPAFKDWQMPTDHALKFICHELDELLRRTQSILGDIKAIQHALAQLCRQVNANTNSIAELVRASTEKTKSNKLKLYMIRKGYRSCLAISTSEYKARANVASRWSFFNSSSVVVEELNCNLDADGWVSDFV